MTENQPQTPRRILARRAWVASIAAAGLWVSAEIAFRPWIEAQNRGADVPSIPCAGLVLGALALVATIFATICAAAALWSLWASRGRGWPTSRRN